MNITSALEHYPAYEAPYWEGARQGRLMIQHCADCGKTQLYPRLVCRHCQSRDLSWRESSGIGHVYSFSVVHRGPSELRHLTPYVLAAIDLEEGARTAARIVAADPLAVAIGDRVAVSFEPVGDAVVPMFRPLAD